MRKAAGAPDPGDENRLLGLQLLVHEETVRSREHGMVPAPGAPARAGALVVVEAEFAIFLDGGEQ